MNKIKEVNEEILSLDTSAENNTIRIMQLEDIQPKNQNKREEIETHKEEATIQILDIPEDFTTSRIKGALKSYGTIIKIQTQPGKRNTFKTAVVKFADLKIDLDNTWAIPMGDTMARIAPAQVGEEIFNQRNQFTARLYGIRHNCSATRIMSAVKHTNAKTIHIPVNSRTGKRRNFAIIGFQDTSSLEKAITRHIYLFGCKTWWSTKDNTKALQKHANKRNEPTYYTQSDSEHESESEWSTDKSRRRSSYSLRNTIQESKKGKDSYKRKEEESQDRQNRNKKKFKQESRDIEHTNTLSALEGALQEIAERLSKLEEKGKKSRIAYRS
jgi:RNA recognition motif-containing protein